MQISYDYYKVFCCVAEHGNITSAAGEMFLTQSTVSRTVLNLEQALGCRLFSRSKKGVTLTPEGEVLYLHLKTAFEQIKQAEDHFTKFKNRKKESLRIGASELTFVFFLVPILERFKNEHPDVAIQVSYSYPGTVFDELSSGALDIAVLASPLLSDRNIKMVRLKQIEYLLIAGNKYAELASGSQDLSHLFELPFVCLEKGSSARMFLDNMASCVSLKKEPEYVVESMPLFISLVQQNFGLGFVPKPHVEEAVRRGDIHEIRTTQPLPPEHICLLIKKDAPKDGMARYFERVLTANL